MHCSLPNVQKPNSQKWIKCSNSSNQNFFHWNNISALFIYCEREFSVCVRGRTTPCFKKWRHSITACWCWAAEFIWLRIPTMRFLEFWSEAKTGIKEMKIRSVGCVCAVLAHRAAEESQPAHHRTENCRKYCTWGTREWTFFCFPYVQFFSPLLFRPHHESHVLELFGVAFESVPRPSDETYEKNLSRCQIAWDVAVDGACVGDFLLSTPLLFLPSCCKLSRKLHFFFASLKWVFMVFGSKGKWGCALLQRENSWIMHIDGRSDAIDNRTFAYTQKGWTTRNLCAAIFVFASKLCAMCFESAENAFPSEKNNFLYMRFTHFFAVVWLFLSFLSWYSGNLFFS